MKSMTIDPTWAWIPYRPTAEQPWNRTRAAHLLRRAGFGATSKEIDAAVAQDSAELVAKMVAPDLDAEFERESDAFATTILASGNPKQLSAWWSYVMLRTPHPLLEKTTLFWHGHFATSAAKVEDSHAMYNQNRLFRQYALGDFSKLTHAISRDPSMLVYLDSATNRKAHPNENFAREVMELFCLGEGNYSEKDIQELARCFTGWEIRRGSFRFNRFQHDTGSKTVLGHSGPMPEGESIDIVLDQPAAPQFIVRKLIRYFLFDEPTASDELVAPLAQELREHAWDISHVVRRILTSQLFYSEHVVGRKVRSPVDLVIGLLRTLEGSTNAYQLGDDLDLLGQGLFYPPNVKGWDGGRAWINSSTLLGRANVIGRIMRDEKTRFAGGNLKEYFNRRGADSAAAIVDQLMEMTLAIQPPQSIKDQLVEVINRPGDPSKRIAEAIHALSTIPEFQVI